MGERLTGSQKVVGSNPISSTNYLATKSSQKFTTELLAKFIFSRLEGLSRKTIQFYRYTLTGFVDYPLSPEGVGSYELTAEGIQTTLKILSRKTDIHCNPHAFRRGLAVHQVKSALSTRVVQAIGGWETIVMVERYSKSLTFDDALQLYKQVHEGEV